MSLTSRFTFLHTAQVHVATFDALLADRGYAGGEHHVAESLLNRARAEGLDSVWDETAELLKSLAANGPVLCTCSTLGPVADTIDGVLRIDRPAMLAALGHGPRPLVVICLESTRAATLDLLRECAGKTELDERVLLCNEAWPHFEAGDQEAFAQAIANAVAADLAAGPARTAVLLAQASMAVAAPATRALTDLPVITTPAAAVDQLIRSNG